KLFDLRQASLVAGKTFGLSGADLQAIRMISREQYLAGERETLVLNYKSRAVGGLGIVAGERGKAVLGTLALSRPSLLQETAREALMQLQLPPTKAGPQK